MFGRKCRSVLNAAADGLLFSAVSIPAGIKKNLCNGNIRNKEIIY